MRFSYSCSGLVAASVSFMAGGTDDWVKMRQAVKLQRIIRWDGTYVLMYLTELMRRGWVEDEEWAVKWGK